MKTVLPARSAELRVAAVRSSTPVALPSGQVGRRHGWRPCAASGFTMVEIALSLGIIAFALVAIIGVLPAGLQVQRENREETIVNQDASYLLEAIRSGSQGVDDLTNYVESISVKRGNQNPIIYTNNIFNPQGYRILTNAQHIISLLSTPNVEWQPNNTYIRNTVTARMRSISGSAMEKGATMGDFAFRYQLTAEVVPLTNMPPAFGVTASHSEALRTANLVQNLYEVRLTARWPLYQRGQTWDVGRYRRTLRTLVSGQLTPVTTNDTPRLYLFQPATFLSYH
jgi:type II secretory pathway pseudopilin PulG